jgi:hypothetical protein
VAVSKRDPAASLPTGSVSWCIPGALTDRSLSLKAGVDARMEGARIVVSTSSDLSSPVYMSDWTFAEVSTGANLSYRTLSYDVTGLTANTTYYYGFQFRNAPSNINVTRSFKTAPPAHTAAAITIAMGSCGHIDQPKGMAKSVIHYSIGLDSPLFFLHIDDLLYVNPSSLTPGEQRDGLMRRYAQQPDVAALSQTTPFFWIPGDHDHGPNDSTLETANAQTIFANSLIAYKETMPHYPFVHEGLVTQVFDIAKVRFIAPDCMTQSSSVNQTGLGRGLGGGDFWDQRSWLADQFTQAGTDYTNGLIEWTILVLPRGWLFYLQTSFADAFAAERQFVCDMIEECACPVLMVTGDTHCVAFEDGTFAGSFATDGHCKFPLIVASALFSDIIFSPSLINASYAYKWNNVDKFHPLTINGVTDGYYVLLSFSSNNKTWTAVCKGTPINQTTFVPTTVDTVSNADVTPAVSFNNTSPSVAHNAVLTIDLNKTWFGACSVNWAGNSQSGTVTFKPNKTRASFTLNAPSSAGSFAITLSSPSGCTISGSNPITVTVT